MSALKNAGAAVPEFGEKVTSIQTGWTTAFIGGGK